MLSAPLERFALCRRGHPANAPSGFFVVPGGPPESWTIAPAGAQKATKPGRTPAPHRLSPHRLNGSSGKPSAWIRVGRGLESAHSLSYSVSPDSCDHRAGASAPFRRGRLAEPPFRRSVESPQTQAPVGRSVSCRRDTARSPRRQRIIDSIDGAADPPTPPGVARGGPG
jgi:hypothetical protein